MGYYRSDATGNLTKYAGSNNRGYMPLGMIFASSVELEELTVKCLNGQNLSINGPYNQFCYWLMDQGSKAPTCDIATYATEIASYGQCGKYVINNTATAQTSGNYTVPAYSIKLPTISEFVASNNGGKELGLAQLDQFKSHDHTQRVLNTYGTNYYGYAHDMERMYSTNWTNSMPTGSTGGSETRPKNIRYPFYVVVAQGVRLQALVDMEKMAEKDASNLTDTDVERWQKKLGAFEYVGEFIGTMPSISGIDLDKYDYMFVAAMGIGYEENLMFGFTNNIPFTNMGLEATGYYGCYITWAKDASAVLYLSKPADTARTAEIICISKGGTTYAFTSSPLTDTVIFHGGSKSYLALGYCTVKMYRSLKK